MGVSVKLLKSENLEEQINNIKLYNCGRDEFIKSYIPFIIKTISKTSGRYVEVENDNFYSIGLEAFNHAIDKYQQDKGNFISFASKVISSKIIDEMRRENTKLKLVVPIEEITTNETKYSEYLESANDNIEKQVIQSEEIKLFINKLLEHRITLESLLTESPKHKDTRLRCFKIARTVSEDDECRDGIWNKAKYMRSRISNLTNASEKILKSNRKIIIASSIAIIGKFETLIGYIDLSGGENRA